MQVKPETARRTSGSDLGTDPTWFVEAPLDDAPRDLNHAWLTSFPVTVQPAAPHARADRLTPQALRDHRLMKAEF